MGILRVPQVPLISEYLGSGMKNLLMHWLHPSVGCTCKPFGHRSYIIWCFVHSGAKQWQITSLYPSIAVYAMLLRWHDHFITMFEDLRGWTSIGIHVLSWRFWCSLGNHKFHKAVIDPQSRPAQVSEFVLDARYGDAEAVEAALAAGVEAQGPIPCSVTAGVNLETFVLTHLCGWYVFEIVFAYIYFYTYRVT